MKKSTYFFELLVIFIFCLSSGNLFSQEENILPREFKADEQRMKSNSGTPSVPTIQSNSPTIIINVPANYSTIQAAINAANNGDIITVDAGIYREDITLNKYLQIRGANYTINPNTGIRITETIIQPGTSDPDNNTFFYITPSGSGSTIDGFTFDGDNNLIVSAVNINGANIDAAEAIGAYDGLSNTTISNNIIKNLNYGGIDLYNYYNGGAATYDNVVTNNKFDNIIPNVFGTAVIIYNNCYTSVTNNVMTRVRVGVQTGNYNQPDLGSNHSISNNTIESSRNAIFHNLVYSNASTFIIDNNIMTTLAGSTDNIGIRFSSIQSAVAVSMNNNSVADAWTGYMLWNCPTSSTITVTGSSASNCNIGVFANNYDGYSSNAATSIYAMTGMTLTNCDTSIWIRDNQLNSNSATVLLNISNVTNLVNGNGIGLLIEGGDASVAFNGAVPVNFNSTLNTYIRLATNGINLPTGTIDAQSVLFDGVTGPASTNTQLFAVEDKIDHKSDWNSLGFVNVKAFNNYTTPNSFYPPNTTAALIQNGINIASAGDTVNVGTGTYNENVLLNKAVTLKGNGPANTILTPAISCTGNGITISSPNSNVNDLTVTDFTYGIVTSASTINLYNVESNLNCSYGISTGNGTNNLNIVKCKLNNNLIGGWRAGTADQLTDILLDSCEVKGNGVAVNSGFGIFLAASSSVTNICDNITIKNSDFSNNLEKGMYFEKLRNALIDNVVMDNSGNDPGYGFNNGIDINLKYGSYSNITIQNSSITNCGATGTATDVNNPAAITVKARDDAPSYNSNPATLTGFVMKNNFVTGPNNGLRFGEFNKVNNSPTGNTIEENNFGNGYSNKAIVNKTSNTITVSCNWYGTTMPTAVVALHGSSLNFLPYLVNGTDNDLGMPGFQIVPGSCTGAGPVNNLTQATNYIAIQPAIDAANPGDTLEASAGTYNERVVITKPLTLQGADKITTILSGSTFPDSGRGILVSNGITNVNIRNMTVQNFAGTNGNTHAGIYAIGGNNNLSVTNVIIQNNVGGSGFYANGPINTVLIDSVTASGHTANARGIVIWNGLKENITITNCEVFNNNCCGIELQDGTASGVTISNNNIHDNFDNGIGIVGLQGPGENVVSNNTLLNNGRFGIEIKNPNGTGLTTGPGRVVIENNNVSRNTGLADVRDLAGIAVFRRGVLPGNVDVPTGAIVQNNTVSGYQQISSSDGFGIVVEGLNHSVLGNTISSCDVGIQRQAGHLPYPGDGDQNNVADTYFGRGNSPQTCGIVMSGNILSNTVETRDVGANTGSGVVMNLNSTEMFCSIQTAIDDAQTLNGHVLTADSGYYNENVVINKEVTIKGSGTTKESRPVVEGSASQTISVTVPNVTIDNVIVKFNQLAVNTGIRAAASGTFNNLTIKNSCVFGTATTGAAIFNSFGIQLGTFGGVQYDQVNLDSNDIKHTGNSPLGRGVKTFNCYGDWKNSIVRAFYAIQSGDIQGGILNITNDSLFGQTEINSLGNGTHSFANNVSNVSNAFGSGTDFAMLELKNISNGSANIEVTGNTFENYVNFGVFSGRSSNVNIDNNTFTPDPTAELFKSIRIDSKQRTTAPQTAFTSNASITNNTFNGNAAFNQKGLSVELASSDSLSSIGTVIIGTLGNENDFNTDVWRNISLNNQTTATSGDPIWTGTYVSTKEKVNVNVDGRNNNFNVGAGLQSPNVMTLPNLFELEDRIQHKIDDGNIGFVLVKNNNDYVTVNSFVAPGITTPSVQRGINAASPGFVVNVGPGSFTEQLEVNKDLTIDGQGTGVTNIISPNTLTLSYVTSGVNKPVIYVHDAAGVIIKDVTIDGAGKGNANNRFQGIGYRNAGGTVRDCEIKAIRNTPIDGAQAGVGIFALADDGNARTLDIISNNIFDFQKNATSLSGIDLTANVDSNTITGAGPVSFIAQNGVQIGFDAAGSVTNNIISNFSYVPSTTVSCGVLLFYLTNPSGTVTTANNDLTGCQVGIYYINVGGMINENTINSTLANNGTATYYGIVADPGDDPRVVPSPFEEDLLAGKNSNLPDNPNIITTSIYRNTLISDGTNGTGIEMDALGTETLNATATENKVNGWDAGVVFYKDAGATLNGVVNDNDLSSNTYALYDLTGVTQNASCNWFGSSDQFVISTKVFGPVSYSPYLVNGTDNDAPTAGFQPVPGSCTGFPIIAYFVNDNSLAGDVFTTAVGSDANPGSTSAPFLTVSYAVSVANDNDTIYIDAGTYQEQVIINKSLTITGADSAGASAAVIKAPLSLNLVPNANAADHTPVVYVSDSGTVVDISHIGIDGDGRGGSKFYGIYYFEAGGSFTNSRITGVRDAVYSGVQSGNAFFANHTYDVNFDHTIIVSDNVIEDYQKTGILINELNTHAIVTNNIVTGQSIQNVNGQNGIQFGYGSYGTITGNTISGNQYNGPAADGAGGILLAGAGVDNFNVPTGNVTIIGGPGALANNLFDNEVALFTDGGGFGYNSNAGITYNANTFATNYIHASLSAPNLVPSGLNVYDKWIDNTAYTNIKYGQIQRSVNDASANHLLQVSAHTFTEQVEIHKAVTLEGQGIGSTTILSPNILPLSFSTGPNNKPVIYVHDTSDVVIKNLTVDGAGKGNANNRFIGIAYRNAGGTVTGCEIKSIRNTPINGAQAGVGIYAFSDNGNPRQLNVVSNNIYDFQKNATVLTGADLSVRVDSNTITGAGPVAFIAQNGVQISSGANGSVRDNIISGLSYTPGTAVSCGVLLFQPSGIDTTSRNTLTGCQVGIYYIDVGGLISENIINSTAVNNGTNVYYGIIADPGGIPHVTAEPLDVVSTSSNRSGNILDNLVLNTEIYRNVLVSDSTNGVGIEMDALGTETLNANVTENKVNGWATGVIFYKDAGAVLNATVNDNDLNTNTIALDNQSGVIQNSTCNWYGATDNVTISAQITGAVNYVPYLTSGTDDQGGVIGFQPVPGSCNGIPNSTINIKVLPEAFYNGLQQLNLSDTMTVYLRSDNSPYNILDTSVAVVDSLTFTGAFTFDLPSGNYYIVIEHRNTIETWSKSGGEVFISGTTMNYDFTDLASKAFGNNMQQVDNSPLTFGIYSGDVTQDGIIDLSDIAVIDNDIFNFITGYVPSDLNADGLVDLTDMTYADNNAFNTIQKVTP